MSSHQALSPNSPSWLNQEETVPLWLTEMSATSTNPRCFMFSLPAFCLASVLLYSHLLWSPNSCPYPLPNHQVGT